MSFGLPLALLIGLLVAGPLIAHVVRRSETPEARLPTFRLLERALADTQRKRRLDDKALFALRALAVLVAAMAAAAPFIRVPLELGDGRACALAIVVDGSRSMLARDGTSPIIEVARSRAERAARGVPNGSEVTLVLAGISPVVLADRAHDPLQAARTTAHIEAKDALGGDTLAQAIHLATRRLHASSYAVRRLVVYSDFAAHVDTGSLGIPAGIETEFVRVAPSDARNAAVELDTIRVDPDARDSRLVRARGRGYGYETRAALTLEVEGVTVDTAVAAIGASPTEVSLRARTARAAPRAQVSIDVEDALPEDDELTFALRVPSQTRVLFVDGESAPNRFEDEVGLAIRALELVPASERRFESTRVDLGSVDDAMLSRHDVVVLANVAALAPETAQSLVHRVREGLGLLVAPGDRTDGRALSRALEDVLPARLGTYARCPERRGVERRDAPDALVSAGLHDAVFQSCTDVDATLGRSRAALTRNDGSALLVLGETGRGRVAVLSSAIDPEGSDIPLRPGFIPFLASLVTHLDGSSSASGERATIGDSVSFDRPGIVVRAPDGSELIARADGRVGPLRVLGPHLVIRDGVTDEDASFTVLPVAGEADLRPVALPRALRSSATSRAARGTLERDVSGPLFLILGVALAAEGFFRERQRGFRRASTTRATPP